jgi:hypothetical protein
LTSVRRQIVFDDFTCISFFNTLDHLDGTSLELKNGSHGIFVFFLHTLC